MSRCIGIRPSVGSVRLTRRLSAVSLAVAIYTVSAGLFQASASPVRNASIRSSQPALLFDDERVVVSEHRIQTSRGALTYEVRVGRVPIRNDDTGQIRGRLFFVAYVVKAKGPRRPITFAWNGGPLVASSIIHMEGLGPRRRDTRGMMDNAETPLVDTDLVFMDAMETGFSRPAAPEFVPEFMNMTGDVNATAEFIRAYRARFGAGDQPLFVAGESYGVFRAAALVDKLSAAHVNVAGAILLSGDIPNIPQPPEFYDAMHVPARVAAAFYHKRLPPELMRDRESTMREAEDWARTVYMPALARRSDLAPQEREAIATALSRYTGIQTTQVNRDTLVVPAQQYLTSFLGLDGSNPLSDEDMRVAVRDDHSDLGSDRAVDDYIRRELGYATDLNYAGLETGYSPFPAPKKLSIRDQWIYNQAGVTPETVAAVKRTWEVSPLARVNPAWIVNAMKQDKNLRVFVATGRFDPLNMCEGNAIAAAQLPPDLGKRMNTHCYDSGHIIFRDPDARVPLLNNISSFIRGTMAARRQEP